MKQEQATAILDQHEVENVIPKHLQEPAAEADWDKMHEHVVGRLVHEGALAGKMYPHADHFYAGPNSVLHVVEDYAARAHGFSSPAHHTVHKALLALTSGNVNPKKNFENTESMINEGKKNGHPILGIPMKNEPRLREWIAEHGIEPHVVEAPWKSAAEFFEQHILDKPAAHKNPGYQSTDGLLHKPSGRVIAVEQSKKWHYTGKWTARRIANLDRKLLKQIDVPLIRDKGIEPANWSLRGQQVIRGLKSIQSLVHNGGYEGAAKYLTTPQDPKGIPENYYEEGHPVEGAFILGPKFGPFSLNLTHEHFGHHLTSDMWHARTMNRYLGQSTGVKGPRNEVERRKWWKMMKEASAKLGISVASLQSRLWSYEQGLHKQLGVHNIDTKTYEDGVKSVQRGKK